MYNKIESGIVKLETVFVCAGLAILIGTVFAAAVLRFFGIDMSWSTDMAQLTFAWISFIGADLALRRERHMGVDLLVKKFSKPVRNLFRLVGYSLMLAFLIAAVYYGISLCMINPDRKYNTLYISYSFSTASCPTGCALMALTAAKRVIECIRRIVRKDYRFFDHKDEERTEVGVC